MARGGRRAGAGRKSKGPRVQLPVRVPPKLRRKLEDLANLNDLSLTQQAQELIEDALILPEWVNPHQPLFGWCGLHQHAFGRIVAQAACRAQAVYAPAGDKRWTDDPVATQCVRALIDAILGEHAARLGELPADEAARAKALGLEIARWVIQGLDRADAPQQRRVDEIIVDAGAARGLQMAGTDFGWKRT
jgi:hypothetical protein